MRILLFIFAIALSAQATTYYVDFSAANDSANGLATSTPWKRAPGMTGFTGTYSHNNGDVFIFKGGETWTSAVYPWTIANSGGSSAALDTYTTDRTWYSGGSFVQPKFDAQETEPTGGMLQGSSKSHLKFNDLHFTNFGTTGEAGTQANAMNFVDGQNITFNACTMNLYCDRALYIHYDTVGTYTNIVLTSNAVSHVASLLWFASSTGTIKRDGLTIAYNTLFDGSSQIGNDIHGDGLLHSFSVPNSSSDQVVTNVLIYNNYCYGDWRRSFDAVGAMTAFIFFEDYCYAKIYNNVFVPYPVQASMFDAFIAIGGSTPLAVCKVELYNNTLLNPGTSSASAGIHFTLTGAGNSVYMTNNIIDGLTYAIYQENTAGTTATDRNCFDSGSGQLVYGGSFQSYATWQGAGRDASSVLGSDPLFVDATGPTFDLGLQSGSPALDVGTTITMTTPDFSGTVRPQGSAYDMGAYEYVTPLSTYRGFSTGGRVQLIGPGSMRQ